MSPAVKLCGFLILLVMVFTTAYAAGARLGPVTTSQTQQSQLRQSQLRQSNGGSMQMGGTSP